MTATGCISTVLSCLLSGGMESFFLSQEQNEEASWLLALVLAVRSTAAFRSRHRLHEVTPQSAFVPTSFLM